ncbi:hypothetical protein ACVWWO_007544 [Bradyrhizobium sp. F1.13.1]
MELIVAGYVKVRDRRALTDWLAHRRKVLAELQAVSGINPENAVRAIQDELAVIEAGLDELKPPPCSLPEKRVELVRVNKINWDKVGRVTEPGRYKRFFGLSKRHFGGH